MYIFYFSQAYSEKENPSSPNMSRAYDPTITSSDILQLSWELGLAQILSGGASEPVIGRSQVPPRLGELEYSSGFSAYSIYHLFTRLKT